MIIRVNVGLSISAQTVHHYRSLRFRGMISSCRYRTHDARSDIRRSSGIHHCSTEKKKSSRRCFFSPDSKSMIKRKSLAKSQIDTRSRLARVKPIGEGGFGF